MAAGQPCRALSAGGGGAPGRVKLDLAAVGQHLHEHVRVQGGRGHDVALRAAAGLPQQRAEVGRQVLHDRLAQAAALLEEEVLQCRVGLGPCAPRRRRKPRAAPRARSARGRGHPCVLALCIAELRSSQEHLFASCLRVPPGCQVSDPWIPSTPAGGTLRGLMRPGAARRARRSATGYS